MVGRCGVVGKLGSWKIHHAGDSDIYIYVGLFGVVWEDNRKSQEKQKTRYT